MDLPTLVFKCPGTQQRPGGTFSWLGAADQAALDKLLSEGWHATLPAAIEAHDSPVAIVKTTEAVDAKLAEQQADNAKPTREELEQKATELGIAFGPKISDKKLGALIDAKLAEQQA